MGQLSTHNIYSDGEVTGEQELPKEIGVLIARQPDLHSVA